MSPRPKVVLIHGAHRSRAGLWPVAVWLQRNGFDARAFGYRTRAHTLQQHAQRLGAWLDAWQSDADEGTAPLGFLTHSMGALVARRYLTEFGTKHAPAHRLVMLGPPNQGASLARSWEGRRIFDLVYGRAAAELQPEQTQRLGPLPAHARGLVIAGGRGERGYNPQIEGDDDGVVALVDTHLEGADHERLGGIHSRLQWRGDVLRRAVEFLGEPDPA